MSTSPPQRRWLSRLVIGVVGVVVLAVGGTFVYIHFIEGKSPATLSLSASPSGSAGGAAVPLDGTWRVAPGTVVGYRVGEVLLGQHNTAVGRTGDVAGDFVISGHVVKSGSFTVDLTTVKSDQSQRDGQFQHRVMDTSKYPDATFTLTAPINITTPAGDATETATATGDLTMHGATKPVTFSVSARQSGATVQVVGSIPIVFADWNIPNPSFGSFAVTQDHGILEFRLDFTKGATTTTTTSPPAASQGPGGPSQPLVPSTTVPVLGF